MSAAPVARLVAAAILTCCSVASADPLVLDLPTALERAHRLAPDAIAARGHIAEAEARTVGAALAFTTNPEVELGAGPRFGSPRSFDLEARLEQELEPGRRGPRRRLARIEVDHARAEGAMQIRELDLAVALAFYDALAADESLALMTATAQLAERAAAVAERRRKAGDITDLDADLAKLALGRARSAVQAEAAERARVIGSLAALVGAAPGDDVTVRGALVPLPMPPVAGARADVQLLEAERATAVAERAQAVSASRPDLALWAAYHREDATSIVLGGLRVTLPVFNAGDGEQAIARAREKRATATRDAVVATSRRQVADAIAARDAAQRALAMFEAEVVPVLDSSERLLQATVDAGQIAIGAFLVARQELATGRREHLERRLALAKAALFVRYAAGATP